MQTPTFQIGQYLKPKNNPHAPTWRIVEPLTETVGQLQINRLKCEAPNNCTRQTMCQTFDFSEVELVEQPTANYK